MTIEKINITNTAITPQNTKKEVVTPEIKPENKSNKNKLIYGSLGALAVIGAAGAFIYKARKGQASKPPTFHPTPSTTAMPKIEKAKNLYSGVETTVSKAGHKMETTWKNGRIVSRTFTPNAERAEKTGLAKLEKKYDYDTMQDIILESNIRTLADGSKTGAYSARFKQTKFAPEIESKIKMQDFDKLNYGDEIASATKKVLDENNIVYDLGDGIAIKQVKDKWDRFEITLVKNGENIRNISGDKYNRHIHSQNDNSIMLYEGTFHNATKYDHKNNVFTSYSEKGNIIRRFTDTDPWKTEVTNLLDTIK